MATQCNSSKAELIAAGRKPRAPSLHPHEAQAMNKGASAATLEHSPGTTVETFVTFLTAAQLKRMHETEGAYFLNEHTHLDLHVGLSLEAYRCSVLPLFNILTDPMILWVKMDCTKA